MRVELGYLNAIDGRPRFTNLADVLFVHLADPEHAVSLQSSTSEIDSPFTTRDYADDLSAWNLQKRGRDIGRATIASIQCDACREKTYTESSTEAISLSNGALSP